MESLIWVSRSCNLSPEAESFARPSSVKELRTDYLPVLVDAATSISRAIGHDSAGLNGVDPWIANGRKRMVVR